MATCKFEQALRLEQRIVHLLQQQHQLGHRAPAIGQIVTDRVKALRVRSEEFIDVVRRRYLARAAHPLPIGQCWKMRLNQVMGRLQAGRSRIVPRQQKLTCRLQVPPGHEGLRLGYGVIQRGLLFSGNIGSN